MVSRRSKTIKVALSLCACFLLASCGSTGNQKVGQLKEEELQSMIKNDLKSKEDVAKVFGNPDGVDFDAKGNEKWVYKYKYSSAKARNFIPIVGAFSRGTDDLKKQVVFVFDQEGKIIRSASSQSEGETSLGIVG